MTATKATRRSLRAVDVGGAIAAASRVLALVTARSLAATDLTIGQFRALMALEAVGPTTMGGLATELQCSPSSASRLCDRLVRKRLVARHPGPSRREVGVAITAKGARLIERVTGRCQADLSQIVNRMPPAARARLLDGSGAFTAAAGMQTSAAWWLS